MKEIKKYKFSKVFDLQNSSRTNFYKNILFPKANHEIWSSSETTLPKDKNKDEFDKHSVLERFVHQLETSGLNTLYTLKPNFSWASTDVSEIKNLDENFYSLYPTVGENLDYINSNGLKIEFLFRKLDQLSWQYCNKGFFNFKNYIPKIITTFNS